MKWDHCQMKSISMKRNAMIIDLDGTLALFDRATVSPYDRDFLQDKPNKSICALFDRFAYDTVIILLSGRKECHRKQTIQWLDMHLIRYDYLYMRVTDDKRCDYTVKQELYNEHIRDKYTVLMVI